MHKISILKNLNINKNFLFIIKGQNLDRASQESDVIVRIGSSYCNVTSLSRSQLTCRPPTSQPHARDVAGFPVPGQLPEVVVCVMFVFKNFNKHKNEVIGSYDQDCDDEHMVVCTILLVLF